MNLTDATLLMVIATLIMAAIALISTISAHFHNKNILDIMQKEYEPVLSVRWRREQLIPIRKDLEEIIRPAIIVKNNGKGTAKNVEIRYRSVDRNGPKDWKKEIIDSISAGGQAEIEWQSIDAETCAIEIDISCDDIFGEKYNFKQKLYLKDEKEK
jgi:hypothetical protein